MMKTFNLPYDLGKTRTIPTIPGMERRERPFDPLPASPKPREDESGPTRPETGSPLKDNLLKRMKKVDPKQAERYRQRTGE